MEGASFYGVMQLSGNLWELAINVHDEPGRRFTGEHGDGTLNLAGEADGVVNWPGIDTLGVGFRGGTWFTPLSKCMVASRPNADTKYMPRSHDTGIRGVRTARKRP